MTSRLIIGPEASTHIVEAFSWYETQRSGLGLEFKGELDTILRLLRDVPEAGPVVYRGLRRVLLHRFPYAVYYSVAPSEVRIRAVFHNRRHPRRWRRFAREA